MTPITIPADEDCYCGKRDWVRGPLHGNGTGVWCDNCGYMAGAVWPEPVGSEQR